MDVREKLVELAQEYFDSVPWYADIADLNAEKFADHLIANGVTFAEDINVPSKWIPVTKRLPTIYDADADNCVLAIHKASNKRYYHWRSVADNPFDFTHWMKTPQPPKGE